MKKLSITLFILFIFTLSISSIAFADTQYDITFVNNCGTAYILGDSVTKASPGEELVIETNYSNLPSGKALKYWIIDDEDTDNNKNRFLFTMPDHDVTFDMAYAIAIYEIELSRDGSDFTEPTLNSMIPPLSSYSIISVNGGTDLIDKVQLDYAKWQEVVDYDKKGRMSWRTLADPYMSTFMEGREYTIAHKFTITDSDYAFWPREHVNIHIPYDGSGWSSPDGAYEDSDELLAVYSDVFCHLNPGYHRVAFYAGDGESMSMGGYQLCVVPDGQTLREYFQDTSYGLMDPYYASTNPARALSHWGPLEYGSIYSYVDFSLDTPVTTNRVYQAYSGIGIFFPTWKGTNQSTRLTDVNYSGDTYIPPIDGIDLDTMEVEYPEGPYVPKINHSGYDNYDFYEIGIEPKEGYVWLTIPNEEGYTENPNITKSDPIGKYKLSWSPTPRRIAQPKIEDTGLTAEWYDETHGSPHLWDNIPAYEFTGYDITPTLDVCEIYDSSVQGSVWQDISAFNIDYDSTYHATGVNEASGDYPYVLRVSTDYNKYYWYDTYQITDDVELYWKIVRKTIQAPSLSNNSFEYTGEEIVVYSGDTNWVQITGYDKATEVGTYDLTVSLRDPINTKWSDGTLEDKVFSWSIEDPTPTYPDKPTLTVEKTEFIYDGTSKKLNITSGFDSETMNISGDEYVNVGNYTANITPKAGKWSDNTSDPVTVNWSISLLDFDDCTITIYPETPTYVYTNDGTGVRPEVTVSYDFGEGLVSLTPVTDYSISFENNTVAGNAQAIITGAGIYAGESTTKDFTIAPANLADVDVSVSVQYNPTYDGTNIKPYISVSVNQIDVLAEETDYTVSYTNNKNAGTAYGTLTAIKNYTGTYDFDFTIEKRPLTAYLSANDKTYDGTVNAEGTIGFSDAIGQISGEEFILDTDYEIISQPEFVDGMAGPDKHVSAIIRIMVNEKTSNYELADINPDATIQLTDTATINAKEFVLKYDEIYPVEYTGEEIIPNVVVYDSGDSTPLIKDNDYYISYSNNINAGTAEFDVVCYGNHTGSGHGTFQILPKLIYPVIEDIPEVTYNGLEQKPALVVKYNDTVLVSGDDYTVSYSNNIIPNTDIGDEKAIATITLKGNYEGTTSKEFTIEKKFLDMEIVAHDKEWDGNKDADVDITFVGLLSGDEMIEDRDYHFFAEFSDSNVGDNKQVSIEVRIEGSNLAELYINDLDAQHETASIKARKVNITIDDIDPVTYDGKEQKPTLNVECDEFGPLTEGIDYEATYENNIDATNEALAIVNLLLPFEGSGEKLFVINKAPLTATLDAEDKTYDGTTNASGDVAFDGLVNGENLVLGTDYTLDNVAFEDADVGTNKEVTATITLLDTAKANNYDLSETALSATANIISKAITPTIEEIDVVTYDGTAQEPTVVVKDGSEVLSSGDYDVSYANNTNVGTATVTVNMKGNYSGEAETTFEIEKAQLTAVLDASNKGYDRTTSATGTVMFDGLVNGEELELDTDYTLNNVIFADPNVGENKEVTATITLLDTAKANNYDLSETALSATATIDPKSIEPTIEEIDALTYNGEEQEPELVVKDEEELLVNEVDYEVTYDNNVDASSEAKAIVTMTGNYTGYKEISFTINKAEVEATIEASDKEYDGTTDTTCEVSFTGLMGDDTLVLDTDYTVSDAKFADANVGEDIEVSATVLVTNNNYTLITSELKTTANITPKEIVPVIEEVEAFTYDGSAKEPTLVVKNGDEIIPSGDYDVTYENNTNAGTAKATVTLKGNYTGSGEKEFTINKGTTTLTLGNLSHKKGKVTPATCSANPEVTDGTIKIEYKVNGEYTETVPAKKGEYEVRATLTGDTNYEDTEVTGTFVIKSNVAPSNPPSDGGSSSGKDDNGNGGNNGDKPQELSSNEGPVTTTGNNVTITPPPSDTDPNAPHTYTFTPDPDYTITDAIVDGQSVGPVDSYTFPNGTEQHTIEVKTEKIPDERTEEVDLKPIKGIVHNATIIPPASDIDPNEPHTYTFVPDPGYEIVDVIIDGESVGPVSEYTFPNGIDEHTIEVKTQRKAGNVLDGTEIISDWALAEVNKAREKGLIPETFRGKDFTKPINRTQFAAVAVKLYEAISGQKAEMPDSNPFIDTNDAYVLKAYKLGITNGTSENTFSATREITREELCTMIVRALTKAGINTQVDLTKVEKFLDDSLMNDWGKSAIYFLSNLGIVKGVGEGYFGTVNNSTIEQALLISVRCVEHFKK